MRIVISNPDTLGDFVLRQPLFSALHQAGHQLLLIVRPATLPFVPFVAPFAQTARFPTNPYESDVEAQWEHFAPLLHEVLDFKPDLFVVAPFQWTDFEEAFARRAAQIPLAGLSGRNTGFPRRDGLQMPAGRSFDLLATVDESVWELAKNEALAHKILGNELSLADPAIELAPSAKNSALAALAALGLRENDYCAVCVGGTANVSIKTWPAERWAEVLSSWMQKHGTRILFTAPRSEAPAINAVRALMPGARAHTFQWIDETNSQLETLVGLLGLSNGYIGHDTGPMHIAAALGKPVLAVFGGGHWPRFVPAAKSSRALTAKVDCIGCGWNCPFEKPYCVQALESSDVLSALNDLTGSNAMQRRDVIAVPLSSSASAAMLKESASIAAREKRELSRQFSTVSQRDAELGVLKTMVRETAAAAESNRMAAVERLSVMESLDGALKRERSELQSVRDRLESLRAEAAAVRTELAGTRNELAGREVELACLNEKSAADAKKIDEQNQAYAMLMKDRNAWVEIYKEAETKLKKNDELYWYERIWDTARRIAKFAVYGRQYVRRPETRKLPSITIVTPVFNCATYIRGTIESVLNQNHPNLEYIIVDGGSTDGTLDIINEYRGRIAHVISEPDTGMYDAVGKGFDVSHGEILAYLNADDMYEPGALLRVAEFFRDHPEAGVIYHENTVSSNGWRFANIAQPHVDMFTLLNRHVLFQDGVFFRRKNYFAVGGVNRKLRRAGDWALWLEMALWFKLHRVSGHASSFRVRSGQISENMDAYNREQDVARMEFKQRLNLKRRIKRLPRFFWTRAKNIAERLFRNRDFFYPADFPNMPPPPGKEPSLNAPRPLCPLTRKTPDRLLLSARHPMLGELEINHIYFKDDSRVALNHPAPNSEQALQLRAQRFAIPPVDWSKPPAGVIAPSAPYASPYAKSKLRGGILARVLRNLWCARVRPHSKFPTPAVALAAHTLGDLASIFDEQNSAVRFLDACCFDGALLDTISAATKWRCAGVEANPAAAAAARAKGHRVVECDIGDVPYAFPIKERFDIVHVGEGFSYLPHPVQTLNALKNLLAPGGILAIASPNLDSIQQEWFGPCWAHWHLTRFHALYSRSAVERLAHSTNMSILRARTFSHAQWTAFSMHFQVHGLAWSTPHIANIPESALNHAARLERLIRNVWDIRGKGDYILALLKNDTGL
ncbi:MAG TPA: glycosyltransferase [Planctomycetota bacterium]|nr:glycosyltransferase [Planctomycetota bacterium]